ncbi:MAG: hypothetical protein IKZ02_00670, partial [Alphaproteobacteria bacterium]|nr:hypothetical protein [Alphaproteobacteria bacterium]
TTKGLTLADGRCACSGRKEWRQDEGDSEPSCKCPVNTPAEANSETCECPDGLDLIDEDGDGINECVKSCASDTGFTGLRNRTTGNCLCDTSKGYKAESETVNGVQMCVCDSSKDYYASGNGCIQCVETTKEWAIKRAKADPHIGLDVNSVPAGIWYCGYHKWANDSIGGERFYNPSTKEFCEYLQVLQKDSNGNFYCSNACGTKRGDGWGSYWDRATSWGFCGCYHGSIWQDNKCVNPCAATNSYLFNGACSPCHVNLWTFDGVTCYGPSCNGIQAWTSGSTNFVYPVWVENTPSYCHSNATNGISGRANQTSDGVCSYQYGCISLNDTLIGCNFNTKITENCKCSTGGSIGQYCCSATTYPTSTGCASCPAGQVPNSSRTGCTTCEPNKITQNGKCVKCQKGYYPSSQQNRCLACPADRTTDEDGLTCSVCIDSNKIFNMITNTCECPPEISFEDPINGSCIFFEDENTEKGESN